MHNIKLIRKEPDFFLKKLGQRNIKIGLKSILDLDKKNRELIQNKEKLEQEKKIISKKQDKNKFFKSILAFLSESFLVKKSGFFLTILISCIIFLLFYKSDRQYR